MNNSNTPQGQAIASKIALVRQDKNSNGTYRYTIVYSDGTEQTIRWRATGNYSHMISYHDARGVSFRSQAVPQSTEYLIFPIHRNGPAGVVPTAPTVEVTSAPSVAQIVPHKAANGLLQYFPQGKELEKIKLNISMCKNMLLTGPTGCGKTVAVEWACHLLGKRVITIQGGNGAKKEELIGYRDVIEQNGASVTVYIAGLITMAMEGDGKEGYVLYCDEPNALPAGIQLYLFRAMDHRRTVTLAEDGGREVKAKPGFTVIGAMNEGAGYTGTSLLSSAMRNRYDYIEQFKYLTPAKEAKLIHDRSGIDTATCDILSRIAENLWKSLASGTMKTPISTRNLINCADFIAQGMPAIEAAEGTIVNQVPEMFTAERKSISDVVAAHFRK